MGAPIATAGSTVVGVDVHVVLVPTPGGPVPTPLPHPHSGAIQSGVSATVLAAGQGVATQDSASTNQPAHLPTPPGTAFQSPPSNQGSVLLGSATVTAGKPVARVGDQVTTCNDPADQPVSSIVAPAGTVMVG